MPFVRGENFPREAAHFFISISKYPTETKTPQAETAANDTASKNENKTPEPKKGAFCLGGRSCDWPRQRRPADR